MEFNTAKLIIGVTFGSMLLLEVVRRRFLHRETTRRHDVILDVAAGILVPALVLPGVLAASTLIAGALIPEHHGAWSHWPWWAMFGVLLLADDLTQYGWHRLSHESWLYPLHRAHHSAAYLSIRVVYRNNLVYYALMPGLWLSGLLIYLGFLKVYVWYVVLKMAVIISAHSSVPWDTWLLAQRWAHPLMWVLERTISTPCTHAAHHGRHAADGVTHYHGNYGNFLFLWDVIFGTAKITRRRPERYGIEGLPEVGWFSELVWPAKRPPPAPVKESSRS